jgi:formylglycine-generating enzyme required for sulfatase activity
VSAQRALILSLGPEEFGGEAWTPADKAAIVRRLRETYQAAADPGLRAAAEWLLRQWQEGAWLRQAEEAWARDGARRRQRLAAVRRALAGDNPGPQWYVNAEGQTMVVLPGPATFVMGSPPSEPGREPDEARHRRRIGRTFAIAAKPVTVAEFRRFDKGHTFTERYAPTPDCPVPGVPWYQAAAYCNWLSGREGIATDQWCYETDPQGRGVKLRANYLSLTGYRLPTEAEWEYACRAGARTSRYYGDAAGLLGKYAWYLPNADNHGWPVGTKKPNDWGLFDMHGNIWNWCQEAYDDYPAAVGGVVEDREQALTIVPEAGRVLRGGAYADPPLDVRAAIRFRETPGENFSYVGFRPARTFRPGRDTASP